MKILKHIDLLTLLIIGLTLISCNQRNHSANATEIQTGKLTISQNTKDKEEIKLLIQQVLNLADSKNSIDLLPVMTDSKDSIYIGFDIDKLKKNLEKLKATNFFATEFIDNYYQIITTLDQGLRSGKYEKWFVGDLPTFIFANDNNPWCNCQDNLEWDKVDVKIISLNENNGELEWFWGNLNPDTDPSWKDFKCRFKVSKEENRWKISYMEGFDFKESTRKDGQL